MSQQITVPFVLPDDVMLFPVAELTPAERNQLGGTERDYAVTRPRSRIASSVIDPDSAALLSRFRTPRTIVDAVINFSREKSADPHAVLASALPVLTRLIHARLLLPAEDQRVRAIVASYETGDAIAGFEITQPIIVLEDVEVYQARASAGQLAVVKIARASATPKMRVVLEREAAMLERVQAPFVPRVLLRGEHRDAPLLALEWREGVSPVSAAEEARLLGDAGRPMLAALCLALVDAYAGLHERGVAHGDVHPGNVLVDRDGGVCILDFGQARVLAAADAAASSRGAAFPYYDPELASARLSGARGVPATAASDQYGLGAMLYETVTGAPHLDFAIKREVALRQVLDEPPLSFAARAVAPWPALESVLARMLAKRPEDRFPTIAGAAEALRVVATASASTSTEPRTPALTTAVSASFSRDLLRRLSLEGTVYQRGFPTGTLCSVNTGAAGVACAWYRLALLRDDADALSLAYAWIQRGFAWSTQPEAFYSSDNVISPKSVGRIALYHTPTGLHAVRALVANASGRPSDVAESVERFVRAGRVRSPFADLTLGRAGVLLGCALLHDALLKPDPSLAKLGHRLTAFFVERWSKVGSVRGSAATVPSLAIAHGWAGELYAVLRWCAAAMTPVPDVARARLDELALAGVRDGRGMSWARHWTSAGDRSPTWCNGDAGLAFLWLQAADTLGDARCLALAEHACWNVWDESRDRAHNLCCGLAGRAYAMLALHRATGDDRWLRFAKLLAGRALVEVHPDDAEGHQLYKGSLGVALLLEELEVPHKARMPMFEPEGWGWKQSSRA